MLSEQAPKTQEETLGETMTKLEKIRQKCDIAERQLEPLQTKLEETTHELIALKQKLAFTAREKRELQARLDAEMSSIEIFKQQRIEKEDELKSRIAQQAARINDLLKEQQKKMRIVEDPATTTPLVEVAAAPNSQINAQRISQLEYDLTEMLNEELSSKLRDVTWELGHIESENKQLISMNENLMEENESFQRMLEEQTASGDIFKSAVMQRSLGRKGGAQKLKSLFESSSDMSSSNGSISSRGAPPHTGVGGDQDKAVVVDEEKEEDEDSVVGTSLMEDLKALALYVSRIVSIE